MNTYSRGAHDVTREPVTSPTRGGPGGHSPRLHTYHHHLQKPWAEPISFVICCNQEIHSRMLQCHQQSNLHLHRMSTMAKNDQTYAIMRTNNIVTEEEEMKIIANQEGYLPTDPKILIAIVGFLGYVSLASYVW